MPQTTAKQLSPLSRTSQVAVRGHYRGVQCFCSSGRLCCCRVAAAAGRRCRRGAALLCIVWRCCLRWHQGLILAICVHANKFWGRCAALVKGWATKPALEVHSRACSRNLLRSASTVRAQCSGERRHGSEGAAAAAPATRAGRRRRWQQQRSCAANCRLQALQPHPSTQLQNAGKGNYACAVVTGR